MKVVIMIIMYITPLILTPHIIKNSLDNKIDDDDIVKNSADKHFIITFAITIVIICSIFFVDY